ncbi:MAG: ribonuclease III [Gammaproteobacteria bacterium]
MDDIGRVETRIDYIFNDQELLRRALTHRSFQKQNNERLEFLGDSILGFIVAESLYHQFPRAPEGDLTKMRARLVRQSTLADLARKLGISDFLILGEGELKSGGSERDSILSDALEAVFGAVYLDGGYRNARTIVLKLFADKLIEINTEDLKDNKTRLQEMLQKKEKPLPVYDVLNQTGEAHDLTFEVKCEIEHPDSPFLAQGRSRRIAEQNAAELAIKALLES